LADNVLANFGNVIGAFRRITEQRVDAGANCCGIELEIFRFTRDARVEISDDFSVT
jgi:hypothetical protein